MTLLELCEPLFLYMCRLNRSARKGGSFEHNQVRGEVRALLKDMRSKAASEPNLVAQFEAIEEVLMFFVDSLIAESNLPFARDWDQDRLAYERKELAGDEKFFDLLEETLKDSSEAATERLAIFYTCMGLGFRGFYAGQPEYLRKRMLECSARLREMMDTDEFSRVCPQAYEHVDARDLIDPPGKKLLGITIALIGLLVVVFIANVWLFKDSANELIKALDKIVGG
jgi:type IV/VI secretion system ImpK/VasF family protein